MREEVTGHHDEVGIQLIQRRHPLLQSQSPRCHVQVRQVQDAQIWLTRIEGGGLSMAQSIGRGLQTRIGEPRGTDESRSTDRSPRT